MLSAYEHVLGRLEDLRLESEKNAKALCPAHDDRNPSLSIKADDDKLLLKCFAGCSTEEVVAALGLELRDLFADDGEREVPFTTGGGGASIPPNDIETVEHSPETPGCTLEHYAEAKRLPVEALRGFGLAEVSYQGRPAVKVPYPDTDGNEVAVRFRTALDGPDKFRWRSGDRPQLYGLPMLKRARISGWVVLVEGESDCHTLWHHNIPALGVPGANNWRDEWAAQLDGVNVIHAVVEPDEAGQRLWERLTASPLRDRLRRVELKGAKDASELHIRTSSEGANFRQRFERALMASVAYRDMAEAEDDKRRREAWAACEGLATSADILARFSEELADSGLAGESRTAEILFLAVTSRLLEKPVSVAVKGPSSGGKSFTVERVLSYFPEGAYYALTSMSERALAYDTEPLSHRMLYIAEASGMEGDMQTFLIRTLLSEGKLRYLTLEKGSEGIKPRLIEREGPTGLIVTTTATRLHPENETRLISLTVADTRDQTRGILAALAEEVTVEPDRGPWLALQTWLETAEHRVTVPYARALAGMVPPVAVRLRRDFGAVLNLIRAHAVLHQAGRERDDRGRIAATPDDYAKVRGLVADLVSEGVGATVPPIVRETVAAVARLLDEGDQHSVTSREVGEELELEKGTVSRRVRLALDAGYLKNLEDRRGRPAQLVLGDDMPEDLRILPTVEDLERECFSVSSVSGGI